MRFPTGIFRFDRINSGGFPAGVVELSGEDGSGKTVLALSVAREVGLLGLPCALIHMQGPAPDVRLARTAGTDLMACITPHYGEGAMQSAYTCLEQGFRLVIVDSVSNVRPASEEWLPVGERDPAAFQLVDHSLRLIREMALQTDSLVLLLSEVRAKLDQRGVKSVYENVMERRSDLRARLKRKGLHTEYGEVDYVDTSIQVTQSAFSRQVGSGAEFRIFWDVGVDRNHELLLSLIEEGHLTQAGSYWRGDGRMFGPGFARAAEMVGARYGHYREMVLYGGKEG